METEKAERESLAKTVSSGTTNGNTSSPSGGTYGLLQGLVGPQVPSLSAGLVSATP